MLAGSRPSLRRSKLRGNQQSLPSSPRPPSENKVEHGLPLRSSQSVADLHGKRGRATTYSEQEQDTKRRRLTNNHTPPHIRIPLRGRAVVSPNFVTQTVTLPESKPHVLELSRPLDSPTHQPQYDQIRIIEEKARQVVRDGGQTANPPAERRKLRSEHGGSRAKTELAQYFPLFEDMLSLEPPDPDLLTARTHLTLVNDTPDYTPPAAKADPFGSSKPLHNTQIISLRLPEGSKHSQWRNGLDVEMYLKVHRKAERHEKQMKNGDRERAQHEKYQLERLLDELRGPDWLKTLGISGVTDTEKKRYEPKRALFIRETKALIDKFKWWKEEEKRRKQERELALLEETAEDIDDDEEGGDSADEGDIKSESQSEDDVDAVETGSWQAPNSSEIDALASQQLLEEAKFASKRKKIVVKPPIEDTSYRPFVSFFEKRHLRDAAVSGRQRGRTILAFGQPVPELEEQEFELPETILTDDAIRASQRQRRRVRRNVDD